MATAAPNISLPLFYNAIEPLNVAQHGKMKVRPVEKSPQIGQTHAIPVTVDEFGLAQRHFPIVFTVGDSPIPIGLMGLNEGVNVFLDGDGRATDPTMYVPAYIRRYPFLLARLEPRKRRAVAVLRPDLGRGRRGQGWRAAVRRRPAERRDQGDPRILRAVRNRRPAHVGVHGRAQEVGPAHGRRGRDPARGLRPAVRLPRVPDGRRREIARSARRRACAR